MKKILCLIDSLGPGGAQRQIVGLASLLKERTYNVMVAVYHDDGFYVNQLNADDIPYVCFRNASNAFLRLWKIARYIRRVKPDVVVSYLETPSICACFAKLCNKKFKLIVSERNTTQHTGIKEKVRFNLFRVADFIIPNAFAQECYIKKEFPKLSEKVLTIPNFVDLQYFTPKYKNRKQKPDVMIAATIWQSKNTLGFIDAVAELKTKGYRFHISWFGKNAAHMDYYNRCQKRIDDLELGDCIELKEKTYDIRKFYQDADFFCLPSFYEGTPNVICEALACGLPIACSDVCDNSEYVIQGENGFLFDPYRTDSICLALERLLSLSNSDFDVFCHNSRKIAELKLSKERFVQSYITLLEK